MKIKSQLETADSFREDMASMIDGDSGADVTFDWDQAQRELLDEAGIDMAKEMEAKLLTVAEEVNVFDLGISLSPLSLKVT